MMEAGMFHPIRFKRGALMLACVATFLLVMVPLPVGARPEDRTSVTVVVKEADTGQPINQAHLTLQFRQPGNPSRLKLPKRLAFSAKTNSQGRYKFTDIPKGTVRLLVTADRHQSFGKDFEVSEDNQVLEVKLKKPQPLL
jgi:carboxypeptidase family protein